MEVFPQQLQLEGETFWSVESAIADPTERDRPATAPKPRAATVTTTATGTTQGLAAVCCPFSKLQKVDLFGKKTTQNCLGIGSCNCYPFFVF